MNVRRLFVLGPLFVLAGAYVAINHATAQSTDAVPTPAPATAAPSDAPEPLLPLNPAASDTFLNVPVAPAAAAPAAPALPAGAPAAPPAQATPAPVAVTAPLPLPKADAPLPAVPLSPAKSDAPAAVAPPAKLSTADDLTVDPSATQVPETAAPEATMSETVTPTATASETALPVATTPRTALPETTAPGAAMPDTLPSLGNTTEDLPAAPSIDLQPITETQEPTTEAPAALPVTSTPSASLPPSGGSQAQANGPEGTGLPGSRSLEGVQMPQLAVKKMYPPEIRVNRETTFVISVKNLGNIPANGVEVVDFIPKKTRLIGTSPQAKQLPGGQLIWDLGKLDPGSEQRIEMRVLPVAEGEVGSVATVRFAMQAAAKTVCTQPVLAVRGSAPKTVLIGETMPVDITLSNTGTGAATDVVLEVELAEQLQHPAGNSLKYVVGVLGAGEEKKLQLPLATVKAGKVASTITVTSDGELTAEYTTHFEVVAPHLEVKLEGAPKRYLEQEAVYQLKVNNNGTATAKDVRLVAYLPEELKFVKASAGSYDAQNRAVYWNLGELPKNEEGAVELVTLPVQAGNTKISVAGSAEKTTAVKTLKDVTVDGIAAIKFEVVDIQDPVPVGGKTRYEVRIVNQGTKAANNILLNVALPNNLKPVACKGPTRYTVKNNTLHFEKLLRLAPKADVAYYVEVQCLAAGDARIKVQLSTDEITTPILKEENTRVFLNQ